MCPYISALYSFIEAESLMFSPGEEKNNLDTGKTFDCNHSKYLWFLPLGLQPAASAI